MQFFLIIYLWKLIFFVKGIQCDINTTIQVYFPSKILSFNQNSPLTEQVMYDLRNQLRKANEMNDFDDEDDDYEYENIETTTQSTISITTTATLETKSNIVKSSSTRFVSKFIYLLLLLIITQTNNSYAI